ncbi:2-keto-3-deoxy-D-arabino-heptulosonate-7-phosphate synthase I alpha [hydrothermal vent metagenome]|uniref:3-deoxy-7-phosphoheptulonate synthase n=1 Tax=hydrothermal vent metagenome TaxID=652676 RepID=A0A3B0YYN0_9ZZZZ
MKYKTNNLRIAGEQLVPAPEELHRVFPITEAATETVHKTRESIHEILHGKSSRLLVIVGPCSIHDPKAGREYAQGLKDLIDELSNDLCIVMRVYFEKPRTTVGWKGLINDPDLDCSFNIDKGLRLAREFLRDVASMGVPAGTEYLDLMSPQYVSDLISWGAIGARTTESQGHRELASGLSCPVGFKNGTDGGLKVAVDAIQAAKEPHVFMSQTNEGRTASFKTTGNDDCHIILRGGKKPNYDAASVRQAIAQLESNEQNTRIMIDCSHANSQKDFARQGEVCRDIATQVKGGNQNIMGVMLESHLVEGRQNITNGLSGLVYGQSVTDGCIAWKETKVLLRELAKAVRVRNGTL